MRRGTIAKIGVLFLISTTAAPGRDSAYQQDGRWVAPAAAAARHNPFTQSPETIGGGRKLFSQHCAECHGEDGRGLDRAPNLGLSVVQSQPDGVLFWKITNGNRRNRMPSFSRLPEARRWQLVLFLRTLPASQAPDLSPGGVRP